MRYRNFEGDFECDPAEAARIKEQRKAAAQVSGEVVVKRSGTVQGGGENDIRVSPGYIPYDVVKRMREDDEAHMAWHGVNSDGEYV